MNEERGLTDRGFKRPSYDEILDAYQNKAVELFGRNVNLTVRSPLGMFLRIFAWFSDILWQISEDVYNNGYVDTATGTSLFNCGKLIGISQLAAQKAIGEVTITGEVGTVIPSGFLLTTASNIRFIVTQRGVIPAGGSITLPIQAQEAGVDGNVGAATITEAVTPMQGITAITNAMPTTQGRERETTEEFRDRYAQSTSLPGGSNSDAIRSEILKVESVGAAVVFENDTDTEDDNGLPPHSIEAIVYGGVDSDIAQAIHRRKSAGIQSYGTSSYSIVDASGNTREIFFSRPENKPVWIKIANLVTDGASDDVQTEIADALIHYIGGTDSAGATSQGLSIGEDVLYNRIPAIINSVQGVVNYTLTIGTDGTTYGYTDISVTNRQVATTDSDKVVVE